MEASSYAFRHNQLPSCQAWSENRRILVELATKLSSEFFLLSTLVSTHIYCPVQKSNHGCPCGRASAAACRYTYFPHDATAGKHGHSGGGWCTVRSTLTYGAIRKSRSPSTQQSRRGCDRSMLPPHAIADLCISPLKTNAFSRLASSFNSPSIPWQYVAASAGSPIIYFPLKNTRPPLSPTLLIKM